MTLQNPDGCLFYNLNELGQTGKQQTERVKKSEPVGFEPARTHLYLAMSYPTAPLGSTADDWMSFLIDTGRL